MVPREPFSSALLMSHLGRWPDAKLIVLDNMSEAIASGDGSENESMDVLRTLGLLRGGRCVLRLLHPRFGCTVRLLSTRRARLLKCPQGRSPHECGTDWRQ